MSVVVEIQLFTYGWSTVAAATGVAFLGHLLGFSCATRARLTRSPRCQARWLLIAAVAIGGAGVWLTRFTAVLGLEVSRTPVRYDPLLTVATMALAVVPVGVGLFLVCRDGHRPVRTVGGGLVAGLGVLAVHYTGVAALEIPGVVRYDPALAAVSAALTVGAATTALWFAGTTGGRLATPVAAAATAVAMCGGYYTGMAAVQVRAYDIPVTVDGVSPSLLIMPITLVTVAVVIVAVVTALRTMTEEELSDQVPGRHRGPAARAA